MADIPEVITTDPHEMLSVGRRHLAVRDYSSAVGCLGQACEMLAQKYGQHADECGEAYLWYGKSLLGLAREESGVLGDGIPQGGGDESQDDKDEDQDAVDEDNNEETEETEEEETKTDKEDAKDEDMELEKVGKEVREESKAKKEELKEEKKESSDVVKKEEIKTDKEDAKDEAMEVEKADEESQDKKVELKGEKQESADVKKEETSDQKDGAAADGKEKVFSAEPSTSEDKEAKDGSDSEDDDDVENLQVAWEVLELARDVFLKRGDRGRKELADVYLHLGEVSLESETYDKAVSDMGKSLDLFKELYSADDRRIAETHYQIGLAHSLSNGFEEAISHFKTAAEILEARIKNLEAPNASEDANVKKYLATDPFYSIDGEVKELKELLPEIQEKIQDMQDYKAEHVRSICESLLATANGTSNGQSSNGQASSSSSSMANGSSSSSAPVKAEEKKASDISHLVRRKRKPSEEAVVEGASVAKKPAP